MEELYQVVEKVCEFLYVSALKNISNDVGMALKKAHESETSKIGKMILGTILRNVEIAKENDMIVCQDTGTPVYLVETSDEANLNFRKLYDAISNGVSNATHKYDLRTNILNPLTRELRGDNVGRGVPIVHLECNGEISSLMRLTCVPKGSGSENQSFLKMLLPAEGIYGVQKFVLESVLEGAAKACAPVIVGVGIGGTSDECAWLAKKAATMRRIDIPNPDKLLGKLEDELLNAINEMGIGPMGLGGKLTALAVNVEVADTHISQLPVAVNLQCWKGQRAQALISEGLQVEYIIRGDQWNMY